MMSKVRRIRYSIRAAICQLVLFALILAPWAFFSRKAALKKADDLLFRRRDKATDSLRITVYSETKWRNADSSTMTSWTSSSDDSFRYTDADGDTYGIADPVLSGCNYTFETDGSGIYTFSYFNFGFIGHAFGMSEDNSLDYMFIEEMNTRITDILSLGIEENLMGTFSGYRYLVTKGEVETFNTDTPPGGGEPTETHWTEERYLLLTVEQAPYLEAWKEDMGKNALALLITWLICVAIIFVLEEKSGVRGILMTTKGDAAKEDTAEPFEETVEYMSPSAAKALLTELEQVEKMTGENGYTKQIRSEISKYL